MDRHNHLSYWYFLSCRMFGWSGYLSICPIGVAHHLLIAHQPCLMEFPCTFQSGPTVQYIRGAALYGCGVFAPFNCVAAQLDSRPCRQRLSDYVVLALLGTCLGYIMCRPTVQAYGKHCVTFHLCRWSCAVDACGCLL